MAGGQYMKIFYRGYGNTE